MYLHTQLGHATFDKQIVGDSRCWMDVPLHVRGRIMETDNKSMETVTKCGDFFYPNSNHLKDTTKRKFLHWPHRMISSLPWIPLPRHLVPGPLQPCTLVFLPLSTADLQVALCGQQREFLTLGWNRECLVTEWGWGSGNGRDPM